MPRGGVSKGDSGCAGHCPAKPATQTLAQVWRRGGGKPGLAVRQCGGALRPGSRARPEADPRPEAGQREDAGLFSARLGWPPTGGGERPLRSTRRDAAGLVRAPGRPRAPRQPPRPERPGCFHKLAQVRGILQARAGQGAPGALARGASAAAAEHAAILGFARQRTTATVAASPEASAAAIRSTASTSPHRLLGRQPARAAGPAFGAQPLSLGRSRALDARSLSERSQPFASVFIGGRRPIRNRRNPSRAAEVTPRRPPPRFPSPLARSFRRACSVAEAEAGGETSVCVK